MFIRSLVFLIISVTFAFSARIVSAHQASWQKIASVGTTFTISMPTPALDSMRLIEWDDKPNMVHVNFYESLTPGRRYLAGEFFRTDRFGGLASFEDFVAGIEYSFKARRGEVVASLSFDPEPDLSDGKAKQYRVQLSHYQGVLRLIRTENAFYALMALGADEKDAVLQHFFRRLRLDQ
jgi:hypothetical protein